MLDEIRAVSLSLVQLSLAEPGFLVLQANRSLAQPAREKVAAGVIVHTAAMSNKPRVCMLTGNR